MYSIYRCKNINISPDGDWWGLDDSTQQLLESKKVVSDRQHEVGSAAGFCRRICQPDLEKAALM